MSASLTLAPTEAVRFHLSLNVADLARSVAFFRTLFGCEPAKVRSDYAKFELEDPLLVLSLEPRAPGKDGALNHMGFRMPNAASLVAMQRRLELAGIHTQREEGVECCYARQTKFWVRDPDQTLWEVYTFDGDLDHRGAGQLPNKVLAPTSQPTPVADAPAVWEHRMDQNVPQRADYADESVDEVRLRGSLNLALSEVERTRLLDEAWRVLRPGGRLFVHVLTGETTFSGPPNLPGPAGAVQVVPVDAEVVRLITTKGFLDGRLLKFDAKPCFVREDIAMREMQLEAWKPAAAQGQTITIVYKGPFREVRDDAGNVFPRGERVTLDAATFARLRSPEWAGHFLIQG